MFLKKNVLYRKYGDSYGLFNTKNGKIIIFDEIGFNIFMLSVIKKFDISSVAESILDRYENTDVITVLEDVEHFLERLIESEFLTEDISESTNINLMTNQYNLETAIIEVTGKCNLNCLHCINSLHLISDEPSSEEIKKIFNELYYLGSHRVVLTGGEPLLRTDILELIKYANSLNLKVIIFTNGTLINDDLLEKLEQCDVFLRISIDGHIPEINDKIRGDGTYNTIVNLLEKLSRYKINFGTSTVVTKYNFEYIEEMINFCNSYKPLEIEVSKIMDNGTQQVQDLLLSKEQLLELRKLNVLYSIKYPAFNKGMKIIPKKEISFDKDNNICNAGINMINITSQLDVYPCYLYQGIDGFKCGNLYDDLLFDIWQDSEVLYKLRNLRLEDIEDCKNCKANTICSGGCRALALKKTDKLTGAIPGDYCNITKEYDCNKEDLIEDINELLNAYGYKV